MAKHPPPFRFHYMLCGLAALVELADEMLTAIKETVDAAALFDPERDRRRKRAAAAFVVPSHWPQDTPQASTRTAASSPVPQPSPADGWLKKEIGRKWRS